MTDDDTFLTPTSGSFSGGWSLQITTERGADYVPLSGLLTFAAGTTTPQMITVTVNGDTKIEPSETFFVDLSASTNALIADSHGVGTIGNDDFTDRPLVAFVTIIKAVHFTELRTLVNDVRSIKGLGQITFSPTLSPGIVVTAQHVNDLYDGLPPVCKPTPWTPPTPGTPITAAQIEALRSAAVNCF